MPWFVFFNCTSIWTEFILTKLFLCLSRLLYRQPIFHGHQGLCSVPLPDVSLRNHWALLIQNFVCRPNSLSVVQPTVSWKANLSTTYMWLFYNSAPPPSPSSLVALKSRMVLLFCCWLIQFVLAIEWGCMHMCVSFLHFDCFDTVSSVTRRAPGL